jgi:hypothetical protein
LSLAVGEGLELGVGIWPSPSTLLLLLLLLLHDPSSLFLLNVVSTGWLRSW